MLYHEGDTCPKCKKEMLAWEMENDTGVCFLICQNIQCGYDATEDNLKKKGE